MTRRAKTPAAVGAASGGDREVLAGAERPDHTPPAGAVTRPSYWTQDAWLHQVSCDATQGNAAFRAAWAVSTLLRQAGVEARTTLQAIGTYAGPGRPDAEACRWIRRGLLSLERSGHLWIDRSAGRGPGRFHRYAVILKGQLV